MSKQMHNIEELLLDYLDGNLDKNKQAFVERYLANNPKVAEELAGLNEITLVPNEEIVYGNKDSLKKTKVFRLPLYTRYAVAAGGALLIGLFLWFSIENNSHKEHFASNISPKQETLKSENKIQLSSTKDVNELNQHNIKTQNIIHSRKTRSTIIDNSNNVATVKRYKNRTAEPGVEEQQMASLNSVDINTNTNFKQEIILASLETKYQTEIVTNSLWRTPVIVNESKMMLVTEPKTFRTRFEELIPNELAKVEARVKNTFKEVDTENIKDKIKTAFQFNKLKEALVPSSVQETITSIQ